MTLETEPTALDFLKISQFGRRKKQGPDKKYATFNRRMMAGTFDSLALLLVTPFIDSLFPISAITMPANGSDPAAAQQALVVALTNSGFLMSWFTNLMVQMLVFFIYSGICWHFWSSTPGKMLLRVKIVDAKTEQPISDQQILLRLWGYFVSSLFFFLGFFWIGFDKRRQGWHDKIADTVVIVLPWAMWKKNAESPPAI